MRSLRWSEKPEEQVRYLHTPLFGRAGSIENGSFPDI